MPLLFLTDFYPPGFRSGGPARSCYNLSVGLSSHTAVRVLTRDRDLGSPLPYPAIPTNTWTSFAPGVEVAYLSPAQQGFWSIIRWVKQSPGAVLYLNSMFSLPFTIYPLLAIKLGLIRGRVVLAPRGMLKASALQFKPFKKRIFLALFKALGWHRLIVFQASSTAEAQDISRVFGSSVQVVTCPPVPEIALMSSRVVHHRSTGVTRFCIIGRIHPIKNMHEALELLAFAESPVQVDVIGPFEDAAYYARCQSIVRQLPATVQVHFHGALPIAETHDLLRQTDFFYLLTQGENFGHAIFEALALGKPVIISDQTPWRQLSDNQAGWDLSLQNKVSIQQALKHAIEMDDGEYQAWSEGAFAHVQAYVAESDWLAAYRDLFFPGGEFASAT